MASAEFLWRLNREYVNRLARARSYLDLLEQMLVGSGAGDTELFLTLQQMRIFLDSLSEEQRQWCYRDFYASPQSKRVVQNTRAIERALISFDQMHAQHRRDLTELAALLDRLPRPAPTVTRVPTGDLWDMMRQALAELADFSAEPEY